MLLRTVCDTELPWPSAEGTSGTHGPHCRTKGSGPALTLVHRHQIWKAQCRTACKTHLVLGCHHRPSTTKGPAHCTYSQGGMVAGSTADHNEPSTPSNLLQVVLQATQEHCRGHIGHQGGSYYTGTARGPGRNPGVTCAGLKVHPASHSIED